MPKASPQFARKGPRGQPQMGSNSWHRATAVYEWVGVVSNGGRRCHVTDGPLRPLPFASTQVLLHQVGVIYQSPWPLDVCNKIWNNSHVTKGGTFSRGKYMIRHHIRLPAAQAVLRSRMPDFSSALFSGVGVWNHLGRFQAIVSKSTRGGLINDVFYDLARQALHGDAGVTLVDNGTRKFFLIDDTATLRLKHVDGSFVPWNYPTDRSNAWNTQLSFPTLPPVPRLDLCYRLDLSGTIIKDAIVQFAIENHAIWRWQVWGPRISAFANVRRDQFGRVVYDYEDYSGGRTP